MYLYCEWPFLYLLNRGWYNGLVIIDRGVI